MFEEKIRVVVADDRPLPRGFFELTVRSCEGYELAASFSAAGAAVSWCLEHPPQLVILDIMMSQGIDGLTAAARLKSAFPDLRIILATSMAEAKWLDEARKLGIEAFWYKDSEVPLPEVMDRVMTGEIVYPDIPQLPIGRVSQTELSDRELDVLRELTACRTGDFLVEMAGETDEKILGEGRFLPVEKVENKSDTLYRIVGAEEKSVKEQFELAAELMEQFKVSGVDL